MLSEDRPLYIGEDNLIEYQGMKRASTGAEITDATITYALKTLAGATVTGGTGSLSHVAGGLYQGTVESTVTALLSDGSEYDLEITPTAGTLNGFRRIRKVAVYRGKT